MSKGLKALKRLENDYNVKGLTLCGIIRKELKALEIIKNKRVNIDLFYYSKNLDDYNRNITMDNRMLSQEEYDLLKEVLL